ncbi:TetR/AcrR family transcriptional regulator, partial [Microbacterium aurantiacum]|uniref:TetR/AcrR family transcriptional regulator n=1 Tax=Microbacterium aurantiacum TaxID=162393 RepID=UPI004037DB03
GWQNRHMDVRVERTRRSLQEALFDLARDRPLEEVTVADIVQRAGVNRSSFYQHYADKETLLADALDTAVDDAGTFLPETITAPDGPQRALTAYLRHIDERADVYRRVLGRHGSAAVASRLRDRIEAVAREGLARMGTGAFEGIPLGVVSAGIAGSALGVIETWLARDPRPSVETAADWVWRVLVGVGDALEHQRQAPGNS